MILASVQGATNVRFLEASQGGQARERVVSGAAWRAGGNRRNVGERPDEPYERGKHEPDFSMVGRIARVLNMPTSFFYAEDDDEARLLRWFYRLGAEERAELMRKVASAQDRP